MYVFQKKQKKFKQRILDKKTADRKQKKIYNIKLPLKCFQNIKRVKLKLKDKSKQLLRVKFHFV